MAFNTFVAYTTILSAEVNENFVNLRDRDIRNEDLTSQVGATVITTVNPYISSSLCVYVDGVRQRKGTNYTESSTDTFTFIAGYIPTAGADIVVDYLRSDL